MRRQHSSERESLWNEITRLTGHVQVSTFVSCVSEFVAFCLLTFWFSRLTAPSLCVRCYKRRGAI
jgi:hypothetical protein